jgi:hypothetical protein
MIAASILVFADSVRAATFNVDTTTDDPARTACSDDTPDDCSLHGAIVAANGLAEESIVTVPAGTYVLTQAASCAYQAKGAAPQPGTYISLCLSSKVTIQGAGATETIVDGNAQHSVLMVAFGAVADVRALTLTNGFGNTHGGGINNQGTLHLTDVVVSNDHQREPQWQQRCRPVRRHDRLCQRSSEELAQEPGTRGLFPARVGNEHWLVGDASSCTRNSTTRRMPWKS